MANYTLGAGESVDLLNRNELAEELDKQTKDWYQERARGLTTATFNTVGNIVAGSILLPLSSEPVVGPRPGFAWSVQRISCQGLAATDTVKIYKGVANDVRFIDQLTPSRLTVYPGSKGLILRAGDNLIFTGSTLSLTGFVSINGEVIEVPELDLYKVL